MSSNVDYAKQAPGETGVVPTHPAEQGYRLVIEDAPAAQIIATPVRRKIAICGFAASSRSLAPFDDPEYEIWGLNQLYRHIPRETRHFDIHVNWREDNVDGTDHPRWLAECGIPVYMTEIEPTIPTSIRYPIERAIKRVVGVDYFTSTVSFMIALAILEFDEQVERELSSRTVSTIFDGDQDDPTVTPLKGAAMVRDAYARREIGIFGIDLVVGDEYIKQKQCVEYLLGIAHARGLMIRIPPQCALLKQQWRYGYEREPSAFPIRLEELQKRQTALGTERNNLLARLQTIDGALQENGYWGQIADLRLKGATVKLNEDT